MTKVKSKVRRTPKKTVVGALRAAGMTADEQRLLVKNVDVAEAAVTALRRKLNVKLRGVRRAIRELEKKHQSEMRDLMRSLKG